MTRDLYEFVSDGQLKSYGLIRPNARTSQPARLGAIWLIRDKWQHPCGHFTIGDRAAKAVIPRS